MVRRLIYFVPATTLLLAALIVATRPNGQISEYSGLLDPLIKDGGHFLGFFLFALSTLFLFAKAYRIEWRIAYLSTIGICAGLALLTEFVQFYVPGREPSIYDLTLDLAGSACGIALSRLIVNNRPYMGTNER